MDREHLQRVRAAADADELRTLLVGLDRDELTGREVHVINGSLDRLAIEPELCIGYAANHTIEPLPPYLRAHAAAEGIWVGQSVGGYDQYFQEMLDPNSALVRAEPALVYLSLSMRRLAPKLHDDFTALGEVELAAERERIVAHLREWAAAAVRQTGALVLVANFPRPPHPAYGIADGKLRLGEAEFYLTLNLELLRAFKDERRVHVLDLDHLVAVFGHARAVDSRMYHLAKMPWTEAFQGRIAEELLRYVIAATGRTRKCLAVDLDGTLWSGVAGEDGPQGVGIGPGDAQGEAHRELQHALKGLKQRGVLLSINSKNNLEDVRAVFRERKGMPLALNDFAAPQINWRSKAENLVAIARALNIGTESLAFLDDNPVECALVGDAMPEVRTIRLDGDPAGFAARIRRDIHFERLSLTDEDRRKSRQYVEQARREQALLEVTDLSTYLRSLGLEVEIRPGRRGDIARIHQLFAKTNQFNVTTRRYSVADIERFLSLPEYDLLLAAARDRFGDLGIIGLALARTGQDVYEVDSFLMSCRALGRGIEAALMNRLKEMASAHGVARICGRFIPTAKNAPAREFFESQGFRPVHRDPDAAVDYEMPVREMRPIPCPHIRLVEEMALA